MTRRGPANRPQKECALSSRKVILGVFERIESREGSRGGVGAGIRNDHDQWGSTGPHRIVCYAPSSSTTLLYPLLYEKKGA